MAIVASDGDRGRRRIGGLEADRYGGVVAGCEPVLEHFEDLWIVTESARRGIPVAVRVVAREGEIMSTPDLPEERK
jgi:hypothetical protein